EPDVLSTAGGEPVDSESSHRADPTGLVRNRDTIEIGDGIRHRVFSHRCRYRDRTALEVPRTYGACALATMLAAANLFQDSTSVGAAVHFLRRKDRRHPVGDRRGDRRIHRLERGPRKFVAHGEFTTQHAAGVGLPDRPQRARNDFVRHRRARRKDIHAVGTGQRPSPLNAHLNLTIYLGVWLVSISMALGTPQSYLSLS